MALLEQYIDIIADLPVKESYEREELLTANFLLAADDNIEIYYCTHNEYVNEGAKVFIVGITPGFQQMNKSIAAARYLIEQKRPLSEIPYLCKREARFSGIIRKNIIDMLNDLDLHEMLGIESCDELFDDKDYLLHTTSLIPYAVFIKGKNYTGHNPKIFNNHLLSRFLDGYFKPQSAALKAALIVPLGKAVEEILVSYVQEGFLNKDNILFGFPHPSGANGHRLKQFDCNKESMRKTVINFWE